MWNTKSTVRLTMYIITTLVAQITHIMSEIVKKNLGIEVKWS